MSRLEPADTIEAKVGVKRHPTDHVALAVTAEGRVYILHSQALSLIHISKPTRLRRNTYAVFCLKKKIQNFSLEKVLN